jgi:TolB protein
MAGVVMALAVVAVSPGLFAADDAKEEKLVFSSATDEGKKLTIVCMHADGSKQATLTKGDAMEVDPVLSPDGKRIAFVVVNKEGKKADIYVMNADGSKRKPILESDANSVAFAPAWSPDGKKIAYSTFKIEEGKPPEETSVMVMDADGKNSKRLADGMLPSWSPDGKKIVYTVLKLGKGFEPRLNVMDADGKNAKKLIDGRAMLGVYSPDGKRLVYTGAPEGENPKPSIHIADADGSNAKQLTKEEKIFDFGARWSADGKRIYFTRMVDGEGGPPKSAAIYVMDADGKNAKKLSKGDGMNLLGGAALFFVMRGSERRKPKPDK